jgi:hypothetical protein
MSDQCKESPYVGRILEIERQRAGAASGEHRVAVVDRDPGGAGYAQHVNPEIRERHGGERTGADAFDFDDLEPLERASIGRREVSCTHRTPSQEIVI